MYYLTTWSNTWCGFLMLFYKACDKFYAADIKANISLTERHRPSKNRDVVLSVGDKIFYYESLEKGLDTWHGSAVVIGADGYFVVRHHGGSVWRLPLLHCCPASSVLGDVLEKDEEARTVDVEDLVVVDEAVE